MAQLHNIITWCDHTLKSHEFKDYAPNGLQIEGCKETTSITCAVTASMDAIEACIKNGSKLLLVHHGYFWKGEAYPIKGMRGNRIKKLIEHQISLVAYHLPLDAHPTLGNNAAIADLLELTDITALDPTQKHPIGNIGTLPIALTAEEFKNKLAQVIQPKILHLPANKTHIKKVGFCTGAAQDFIEHAEKQACDAYLSGEVSERTFYEAKELNVHYYACGHHSTERYGVQRLGQAMCKQFDLDYHYFEQNNPV
ncbi:Nif3-like dinuclear metal center hexameric protein [Acinetobacter sp. B10A]|uniref:Nif3-like dinuclear metal center hexameric protein n=1 Tax=Acinetobacter baretiae TaxID=2605383 RepID=UPI001B3C7A97|nr:Nif3-like dinuclear metal center hexameric protein [Acinetobacter baretiae]MBF7684241.1 Nif3-like dinuclear metal center hexameric protein [Acinetobacter baretiae]